MDAPKHLASVSFHGVSGNIVDCVLSPSILTAVWFVSRSLGSLGRRVETRVWLRSG